MTERLLSALEASLTGAGLWNSDAALLAAVSGGADSVSLLYALTLARRELGFRLYACYVQHGLRGENSLRDEAFVRELCQNLDVPLTVREADLHMSMDDPGIETAARKRRRELFIACMETTQADAVLTGHHLDDQAETVLLRLLRGSGAKGLCGILPVVPFGRGVMLRPFLGLKRQELQAALEAAGIGWRHDESNDVCCTPRNTLRLDIIPRMEALFPEAARHIAQAADSLRKDEASLEAQAEALYRKARCVYPSIFALEVEPLLAAPAALELRALRRLYREGLTLAGFAPEERELSRADSLALNALLPAQPGASLNLPCGLRALRGQRCLHLTLQSGASLSSVSPSRPIFMRAEPGRYLFQGMVLEVTQGYTPPSPMDGSERRICIPAELLARCVLRVPYHGDVIQPLGAPGSKPLRRFFTDRRMDMPFRPVLPVLAIYNRVLWIPGLVTAEELRRKEGGEQFTITVTRPKKRFPYRLKE